MKLWNKVATRFSTEVADIIMESINEEDMSSYIFVEKTNDGYVMVTEGEPGDFSGLLFVDPSYDQPLPETLIAPEIRLTEKGYRINYTDGDSILKVDFSDLRPWNYELSQ